MSHGVWSRRSGESPFNGEWVETVLASYARRAAEGEPVEVLHEEIIEQLVPWALSTAEFTLRRLPASVDPDAMRSEVLWELVQSVRRIDWERYDRWLGLLKSRIRGAVTAVYRDEDVLTRGQRAARRKFLAVESELEQRRGQSLSPGEKRRLAEELAPRGGLTAVLGGALRPVTAEDALEVEDRGRGTEERVLSNLRVRAVRQWVAQDLPAELAGRVLKWLRRDTGALDRALRRDLVRHVPRLVARLP
ncbi:hypothetical protein ACIQUL_29375 [Streptomyces sp. NPDC090303]|uniref:hypothetical protein n=1 Tax=Streptomyces sp. NPDC090303 TaxID=3365960 RepID=UPI0037F997BF